MLPLLAVVMLAAVSCGKGSYRANRPGEPSPARAPARASAPLKRAGASRPATPARSRAFGHAVNLSTADIPGASVAPGRQRPEAEGRETRRCGGAVSSAGAVQVKSPDFIRGAALTREAISSDVTVLSSARLAGESVTGIGRGSWLACYERVLRHRFAGDSASGVRVDSVDVSTVPVGIAALGGKTFGVRILARLTSRRSRLSIGLYLDVFGFAMGPAEINMDATSYVQPVATRTEQDLLRLMYMRALAHPL